MNLMDPHSLEQAKSNVCLHKKDARRALIDSATPLFAQFGLHGTSTRDIAKAAQVNISLISYYFGGKEGLYKAVFEDYANQVEILLVPILNSVNVSELTRDVFLKLFKKIITTTVHMKFANPHMTPLLQREAISGLPYAREIYEGAFRALGEKIIALLEEGQRQGFVKKQLNPTLLFLSFVHSTDMYFSVSSCRISILEKCYQLPEEAEKYVEQIYFIFIEGSCL